MAGGWMGWPQVRRPPCGEQDRVAPWSRSRAQGSTRYAGPAFAPAREEARSGGTRGNPCPQAAPGKWQPIECYTYRLPAEEDYDETGGVQIETREDLSRVL